MADSETEKQKVKEITDKLEEGLKEIFESEKYKNYLSVMSKFHNYSFNNTLLIAMQKPDATLVAGYRAWQKNFNRHVNKGEKGIRILAPVPYKIKKERDKLDPMTGKVMFDKNGMPQTEEVEIKIPAFRAVSVFDVSQTDGEPIPELESKELLSTVEGYEDFIKAVTFVAPVPISFEDIPGDSKGFFSPAEKRIIVQEGMSESQMLKTMLHEIAHSMLHDNEVNKDILAPAKDRNTKEVEAESIAYTVCRHFGIDTAQYSFGYIAGWSTGHDMKELKSSLDTIRRTASELITGIDEQLKGLQRDREIMQEEKESKGEWNMEIANEKTRGFKEYQPDVNFIKDANDIIDLKAETQTEHKDFRDFYGHTLKYAMEHGEVDKCIDSRKIDRECKKAIEEMIGQNFDGMHLKDYVAKPLAEQYGLERMAFILANTIRQRSWDGRFSMDNRAWAEEFFISENIVNGIDKERELIVNSHPAVLDGFIDMFRSEVLEKKKELSAKQDKVISEHDVQKSETEQPEHKEAEKSAEAPEFGNMEDGDEIIDLGDEKEQVLAEMKKFLAGNEENILDNGAGEKEQKEQERPAKTSLKARIAENKKVLISDQKKEHETQKNIKNDQRGI